MTLDKVNVTQLEHRLSHKERVVSYRYPVVEIDYWEVSYDPDTYMVDREGTRLPWCASSPSRYYNCSTLHGLLDALKRNAEEEQEATG